MNLTKRSMRQSSLLRHNKDVVIKPTDKGSAIVIIDKLAYIQAGDKTVNTHFYEEFQEDVTCEVTHRVNLHPHNFLEKGQITEILIDI